MSRTAEKIQEHATSARTRAIVIAIATLALGCWAVFEILNVDQPLVFALFLTGLAMVPWVIVNPYFGLALFLWAIHSIDGIKRLLYSGSAFSYHDVAKILIVPIIIAIGLYLRVFLLNWFGRYRVPRVEYSKFILIFAAAAGAMILTFKGGFSFDAIASNYTLSCYIPAAIVVPYLLFCPARQLQFSKWLLIILIVVGVYGLVQSIRGPWPFEIAYLRSGLTTTSVLYEGTFFFRAFSLLNSSSTFSGVMVSATFLSYLYLCRSDYELRPRASVVAVTLFTAVVCFAATQRGSFFCFLITLALLPLFTRPKLFLLASLAGIAAFAGLITYALELKELMYVVHEWLMSRVSSGFMQQSANILTLGQRLDGFADLKNPLLWTPFGVATDIKQSETHNHDMLSNFLEWFGYVGTSMFFLLVVTVIYYSITRMQKLKSQPPLLMWCQMNLAVFIFFMVWGMLLGSSIHVSPMNFYFWMAIGNLLFVSQGLARQDDAIDEGKESPAAQTNGPERPSTDFGFARRRAGSPRPGTLPRPRPVLTQRH